MPWSCEPICVASRMRCDSPPLSVFEGRFNERYERPTSKRNCNRSRISFSTSLAISFCLSEILNSIPSNQAARLSKFMLLNSEIFLPTILNQRLSFFNLAPPQVSQGFNSIYPSAHSRNPSLYPLLNQRFSLFTIPSNGD